MNDFDKKMLELGYTKVAGRQYFNEHQGYIHLDEETLENASWKIFLLGKFCKEKEIVRVLNIERHL